MNEKQKIKFKLKILSFLSVFGIFILFAPKAEAIGIMSKPIEIDNALRGQVVKEELKILNNNPEKSKFNLIATEDIKDWTVFIYNDEVVNSLEIASNTREIVNVEIKIPEDVPNKEYSGSLQVEYNPSKDENDSISVSVTQRVSRDVFIRVTDQEIISLIRSVSPKDYVIKKEEPLRIKANYYNEGNILLRPDLQIKINKNNKNVHNFIYPYPEDKEAVEPREQEEIIVSYNLADLDSGKYQVETTVLLNSQEMEKDNFTFAIVDFNQYFGFLLSNFWFSGIIFSIVLLAFILTFIFKRDLKYNKKI